MDSCHELRAGPSQNSYAFPRRNAPSCMSPDPSRWTLSFICPISTLLIPSSMRPSQTHLYTLYPTSPDPTPLSAPLGPQEPGCALWWEPSLRERAAHRERLPSAHGKQPSPYSASTVALTRERIEDKPLPAEQTLFPEAQERETAWSLNKHWTRPPCASCPV